MNYKLFVLFSLFFVANNSVAQKDSSSIKRMDPDTSKLNMNLDAVYNRPFLQMGKIPVALGGYMEVNTNYSATDGVTEGFGFQFKRLTMFMSSTITKKIKFLSELEFEDGTKEINIEFAALDFEMHPMLNLRGGIVMNPIGAFNQNHDGPKWEFIERPISATQMLPATWSNAGFGLHGKYYQSNWVFGYEAYLTNGFDESIISNTEGKTFLPATKGNRDRFEDNFSGEPMITGKVAVKRRRVGEIGLSYMGGVYNKYQLDGVIIDDKRRVNVIAVDINSTIPKTNTTFVGEFAMVSLNVPTAYVENFGKKQRGGYLDIVQPILKRKMFGWEKATLNLAFRTEYVDWNVGNFELTGTKIYEHVFGIVPGISFRPSGQTVIRFNYRYQWQRDLLGNPAARTAAIQFGVSSYF
ncbi:MAG: hypothetical protein Q8M29_06495 [Bacteroidota bacterium]|nr:hypothetical protein [Bacteroidota bacterium]